MYRNFGKKPIKIIIKSVYIFIIPIKNLITIRLFRFENIVMYMDGRLIPAFFNEHLY